MAHLDPVDKAVDEVAVSCDDLDVFHLTIVTEERKFNKRTGSML